MIESTRRQQFRTDNRLIAHLDQEWTKAKVWARSADPIRICELSAVRTAQRPPRETLAHLDAHQAEAVLRLARLALGQTLRSAFGADPDPT